MAQNCQCEVEPWMEMVRWSIQKTSWVRIPVALEAGEDTPEQLSAGVSAGAKA